MNAIEINKILDTFWKNHLTLNRLGGHFGAPPHPYPSSFFFPSTLIFDTITVKFCDF